MAAFTLRSLRPFTIASAPLAAWFSLTPQMGGAQVVLMAKNGVDGVFDDDPKLNAAAVKFDEISHAEVLARGLRVADATAISLCMDNKLPIVVFDLLIAGNIGRAVRGERIGTLVATGALIV